MRILVDPDQLRDTAEQIRRAQSKLQSIRGYVGRAHSNLSLEIRARTGVDQQAAEAYRQAASVVSQAEALAQFLEERAGVFQRADEQVLTLLEMQNGRANLASTLSVGLLGAAFVSVIGGTLASIGGLIVPALETRITTLLSANLESYECFLNWLGGCGWRTNPEVDRLLPEIDGFGNSKTLSNDEVQNFLVDEFPPRHVSKRHLREIEYTDRYVSSKPGFCTLGSCLTFFSLKRSWIEINRQNPEGSTDGAKMKSTVSHEVAHNVYYNVVAGDVRQEWDGISKSSEADEYVSDYATTMIEEDFAETYAFYMLDPEALREVSQEKYAFMRDHVFEGREY